MAFVNASEVYTVTGIRGEEVLSDTVTFLTSAISGQILPESIAADVSKLDLQVGQAKEVHVSYVPNTANVELTIQQRSLGWREVLSRPARPSR